MPGHLAKAPRPCSISCGQAPLSEDSQLKDTVRHGWLLYALSDVPIAAKTVEEEPERSGPGQCVLEPS
jgi:hypothetical protein